MAKTLKLLLVEDNKADAAIMTRLLKESGLLHSLTIVDDGDNVIAALDQHMPDLIILDLNLPHKNGHQVLAEIKTHTLHRAIPVVILTTSADQSDIFRSYNGYAAGYIVKPVNLESARLAVQSLSIYWGEVVSLPGKEETWDY